MEPAFEVNKEGTREKIDVDEYSNISDNEKIEVFSDEVSFVKKDWVEPEQDEIQKSKQPVNPLTMDTRRGRCNCMASNRYEEDFLIDKMKPA